MGLSRRRQVDGPPGQGDSVGEEELGDLVSGLGPGDVETMGQAAAQLTHKLELRGVLDTLDDRADPQGVRQTRRVKERVGAGAGRRQPGAER